VTISIVVLSVLVIWAITRFYLRGEDLSRFDHDGHVVRGQRLRPSDGHYEAIELLRELTGSSESKMPRRQQLHFLRGKMDEMGDRADLSGVEIRTVDCDGVPGEWVLAGDADPARRLLYLHGGAFTMGSPRSHRAISSRLSRIAGASVLVVDYRLMPENRRLDGLEDCQRAYRWVLANGPQGPSPLETLFVAGDSAGGNLCLVLIAWARDAGLRAADGAVALSPATDSTMSSPSLISNLHSDHMLGPVFGHLARVPSSVLLWMAWLGNRLRPCDPRVSPAHGDLSGLPPTLVHASEAEMLLDDARRYVNKAKAAGSPATLETWHDMLHVWHAFESTVPEAMEAYAHIGEFLERCKPRNKENAS
jgi:acetyl esterase/lipase